MQLITVTCNNCGAPLSIPEGAKYVTCKHCNSRLEVKHTEDATFTEKLEELEDRTDHLAVQIEVLRLDNEMQNLDRRWSVEKKRYMIKDKRGNESIPTVESSVLGGTVLSIFGIGGAIVSLSAGVPPFALGGLIMVGMGIWAGVNGSSKANAYQAAQRRHRRRRAKLSKRKAELLRQV